MSITQATVRTKIPARLDRLPWTSWHWYVVMSLGTVWLLDGLEVTFKGALGPTLKTQLHFSTQQVASAASIYIAGAISGALLWGYLTDRLGRRRLFMVTLATYMTGVILTTISWDWFTFVAFRFITGFGIGGEYSAINSTIDELIPARARGWVDLAINGSYWAGALLADVLAFGYLTLLPGSIAWRIAFATGALLAVGLLLLRRNVPESPRWLMTHGRAEEAERITRAIEEDVAEHADRAGFDEPGDDRAIEVRQRESIGFVTIGKTMFVAYPKRAVVAFSLMGTQAFLYNAIFFTFGLTISTYYGVSAIHVPLWQVPFAIGNWLGPLVLGRYFDSVGRRPMIGGSYLLSGAILIGTGWWFTGGLTLWLFVTMLTVTFFFASAGASAGYLTASETFPLEIRAMVIALVYSLSTAFGGIVGPNIFGSLIHKGDRMTFFYGLLIGAGLMIAGGLIELMWGVRAERKSLENIALPLTAQEARGGGAAADAGAEGPAGVAPASAESIRAFQEAHDLRRTGTVDESTQAAIRAARAEHDLDGADRHAVGVDAADPDDVRRLQRRHGLSETGVVDAPTRGALRVAQLPGFVDVLDPDAVRRFQRDHGLPETGDVDDETRVAILAVRADAAVPTAGEDGEAADRSCEDAIQAYDELDPADAESIRRFQRVLRLDDDGIIGEETRGALRAMRARRLTGGTDRDAVRSVQRQARLPETGSLDASTREALREHVARGMRVPHKPAGDSAPDPADADSVRRFQRRYGLADDGIVGERTRQALRWERDHELLLDPTDADGVRAFQEEHRLEADGVIGEETQAAIRAARAERVPNDDDERADRYGDVVTDDGFGPRLRVDVGDADSVVEFQREHRITADGVVGDETRTAMRAVRAARTGDPPPPDRQAGGDGAPAAEDAREWTRAFRTPVSSPFPANASIPDDSAALAEEIEAVVRALRGHDALTRTQLREVTGAREWGPGRLGRALHVAERTGRVERVRRRVYRASQRDVTGSRRG